MQDQIEARLTELKGMIGRSAEQDAELSDLEKQLEFLQASNNQPVQPQPESQPTTDQSAPETTPEVTESAPAPQPEASVDAQAPVVQENSVDAQPQQEAAPEVQPETVWTDASQTDANQTETPQQETQPEVQAQPQVEGQAVPEENNTMVTSYSAQDEQPTVQPDTQPDEYASQQATYGNPDEATQQPSKEGLKQRLRDLVAELVRIFEAL